MNEKIMYRFSLPSGRMIDFPLEFDSKTFAYIPREAAPEPWTALDFEKCTSCPLKAETYPQCPIARGLQEVAVAFRDVLSHELANVMVITEARNYIKRVPVQEGLFAIFGLLMATSGCPHLDFLRPLARFHLPFATPDEYNVRFLSMYLLQQHLKKRRGELPDYDLTAPPAFFARITDVNASVTKRIRAVAKRDAGLNSLTMLDSYAQLFLMTFPDGNDVEKFFFND